MNLLCNLFGHHIDEGPAEFYSVYHCLRCDNCEADLEVGIKENAGIWLRSRRNSIIERYREFRMWLTCTDCGSHFGKHDDSYDHIPF